LLLRRDPMGRSKYISSYLFEEVDEALDRHYVKSMGLILVSTLAIIIGNVVAVVLNNILVALASLIVHVVLTLMPDGLERWKLEVGWRSFEEHYEAPGNYLLKAQRISAVDEVLNKGVDLILDREVQRAYYLYERGREFLARKLDRIKSKQRIAIIISTTSYLLAIPVIYLMILLIGRNWPPHYIIVLLMPVLLSLMKIMRRF